MNKVTGTSPLLTATCRSFLSVSSVITLSPQSLLNRASSSTPMISLSNTFLLLRPSFSHSLSRLTISACSSSPSRRYSNRRAESTVLKPPEKNLTSSPFSISGDYEGSLLPNQALGFVAASQANFMRVVVERTGTIDNDADGAEEGRIGTDLLCVVRALLKKIKRRVLVGDKVIVSSIDWTDKRGMIENVFERKSEVSDPPIANVDHLMVMFALDQPKLEPFNLTRFLVEAESSQIPVSLVLNKSELVREEVLFDWKERLQKWGYKPLFCSVEKQAGLETVKEILKGQTTVIMGPSGVGKSSLINALRTVLGKKDDDEEEEDRMNRLLEQNKRWFGEQKVGTVSKKSGKGKHTTRHVSLLPLADGGFLADTPGFNQPHLIKVTKANLPQLFPEIRNAIKKSWPLTCSFNDCLHLGEPGCVVKGESFERYSYYLQLLDEIKIREEFQFRTYGTKKESEVRYKTGSMGVKQAEPRLNRKKHRRVSRKQLNQTVLDDLDDY